MGTVERSIEVNVPVSTAYNQWTQFGDFPRFMEGVEEIRQIHEHHLYWRVKLAGVAREFHAEIVEQRPDERIAWRSSEGAMHAGVVTFQGLGDARTRVSVRIHEEPEGVAERLGEAAGLLDSRVQGDLERFKRMIESREGWQAEFERPGGRFGRAAETPATVPPHGGR
ncbi:MAG TPA: SRPBCC family protein [Solirubrobacteraceae bacterium]|jgi:uncharacterized membrane protein